MSAVPDEFAKLKAQLERLRKEGRWGEIRDRAVSLDDSVLTADPKVAYLVAEALFYSGQMDRALHLVLAAEVEFRARHDRGGLLPALNLAGAVQFELGDLQGAEERFSDLLEIARESGDDEMTGRATNNLGAIASLKGDAPQALSLFLLSIPLYQKVGFLRGLALTEHNLGIVNRDLGYWREAERHYRSAQRRARQLGDERVAAMARAGRAEVSHLRGDQALADVEARQALETFTELGDELGRAEALKLLGSIAAASAKGESATRCFDEALKLARDNSNPLLEAEVLEERASLHSGTGRIALARADLEAAMATYRRLGATGRQHTANDKLIRLALPNRDS
jgi:tetratricopeptide (TPR) repeat protein